MNNIFLETDRLILRRLEESDFPDYAAYAVDNEMSRMMGRPILKQKRISAPISAGSRTRNLVVTAL